jgi:hypothetical protein
MLWPKTGNPAATVEDRKKYKKARYDLHRVIKRAKSQYRKKSQYILNRLRCPPHMERLQSITDYKGRPNCDLPNDASLPDELGSVFSSDTMLFVIALLSFEFARKAFHCTHTHTHTFTTYTRLTGPVHIPNMFNYTVHCCVKKRCVCVCVCVWVCLLNTAVDSHALALLSDH